MLKRFTAAAAGAAFLFSGAALAKDDWFPSKHGKDDQAGQSNLMTPDRVKAAMGLIKQGKVVSLARTYSDQDATVRSSQMGNARHQWPFRRATRRQQSHLDG